MKSWRVRICTAYQKNWKPSFANLNWFLRTAIYYRLVIRLAPKKRLRFIQQRLLAARKSRPLVSYSVQAQRMIFRIRTSKVFYFWWLFKENFQQALYLARIHHYHRCHLRCTHLHLKLLYSFIPVWCRFVPIQQMLHQRRTGPRRCLLIARGSRLYWYPCGCAHYHCRCGGYQWVCQGCHCQRNLWILRIRLLPRQHCGEACPSWWPRECHWHGLLLEHCLCCSKTPQMDDLCYQPR